MTKKVKKPNMDFTQREDLDFEAAKTKKPLPSISRDELKQLIKDNLTVNVLVDHSERWPDGCGGDLRVRVRLYWAGDLVCEDVGSE